MGAFDRSKFAATKVTKLEEQESRQEQVSGRKKDRVDFKRVKNGKNKIRLYPAHPGTPSFMYPRTVHFLPVEVPKWDDDAKKYLEDELEIRRKPIFSAKVHLGLQNGQVPKCPTDEYLTRAIQWCHDEIQDDEERKAKMKILTGQKGIKGATKWIAYADLYSGDTSEFCRIELATSVQQAINEIAAGQDGDDGVIVTDPFTDPDTGRLLIVTYNKDAKKPADYYKSTIDINKETPLTDDQLDALVKQPSLESLLVNSYRKSDFDYMIEGLKRFDEEHGFGIFGDETFLDVLEEIGEYEFAPEKDDAKEESNTDSTEKVAETSSQASEETTEEKSDLPFDKELIEMSRDELVGYIRRNSLDIRVLPRYTAEDLIEFIKEEEQLKAEDEKAQEEQAESDSAEETSTEETPAPSRRGRGNRLSSLAGGES